MDNEKIKSLISYVLLTSIFITGGVLDVGFTLEWYYPFYLLFALISFLLYRQFSARLAIFLLAIVTLSLFTYQYDVSLVWKQLINIAFSVFVFYNFMVWEKWDIESIFRKYVKLSKIVLVIGFFQVIAFALAPYSGELTTKLFLTVFPFLAETNISVRFQSLTSEPALIAFAFAPVVFLSLYNLSQRSGYLFCRIWSGAFVLGYFLTFSIIAYAGVLIMLLILYFRNFTYGKLAFSFMMAAVLTTLGVIVYTSIPSIKLRVDDTLYGFTNDITKPAVYREVNLSTYATLSNVYVTKLSLHEFPWTGSGLGTYQLNYSTHLPEPMQEYSQLNRQDAASLALRLLSETGYIGFFAFILFVFRFRLKSRSWFNDNQEFMWLVNAGIFVMTLLFLIRAGNYTYQAKILFLMMYYISYRAVKP